MTESWADRVFAAMGSDCPRKPAACAADFKIVCDSGWPYRGECVACGRKWNVYKATLKRFPSGNETEANTGDKPK